MRAKIGSTFPVARATLQYLPLKYILIKTSANQSVLGLRIIVLYFDRSIFLLSRELQSA
jgi:hypothetical protein